MEDIELKPVGSSHRLRPLGIAPIGSVSSITGRCASYSEFAKKGISRASSSALNGVQVESPKERKVKRLMFAPVAEVNEAPSVHYSDDGSEETGNSMSISAMEEEEDFDEDINDRIEKSVGSSWLKRILHRIPLVQKALVLVLIPVLALFIMSVIDLRSSLDAKAETEKVLEFTSLVKSVKVLTNSLMNTGLYGIVGTMLPIPDVLGPYEQLVQGTNLAYEQFKLETERLDLEDIYDQPAWKDAIRGIERHVLISKKLLAGQLTLDEAGEYYVGTITSLVSSLAAGGQLSSNSDIRSAILATYYHSMLYVNWGLEMAGPIVALYTGGIPSEAAYRLYLKTVTSTDRYTELMFSMNEATVIEDRYYGNSTQNVILAYRAVREYMYLRSFHPTIGYNELLGGYYVLSEELSAEVGDLIDYTTDLCQQENDDASNTVAMIAVGLVLLTLISCGLVTLFVSSVNTMTGILQKEVETRQNTERAVWRFFPQEFISYLNAADIFHLRPGDRTKLPMTVVFAQLINFKDVSGNSTAEQTYDWLTDFIREMIPIVSKHSGFVDKNTGDGILALFATPEDAVYASLEMQAKVTELNAYGTLNDEPEYDLGIGVHSGEVVLGLLGTHKRLEGTIISDTVNTASRVQGMCKFYGSRIVVSEVIAAVVDVESLGCRCLGEVRMKGKVEALRLYDIFLQDEKIIRELKQSTVEEFRGALELYQDGRFEECKAFVDRVIALNAVSVRDPGLLRRREFADTLGEFDQVPQWWSGEDVFDKK